MVLGLVEDKRMGLLIERRADGEEEGGGKVEEEEADVEEVEGEAEEVGEGMGVHHKGVEKTVGVRMAQEGDVQVDQEVSTEGEVEVQVEEAEAREENTCLAIIKGQQPGTLDLGM